MSMTIILLISNSAIYVRDYSQLVFNYFICERDNDRVIDLKMASSFEHAHNDG